MVGQCEVRLDQHGHGWALVSLVSLRAEQLAQGRLVTLYLPTRAQLSQRWQRQVWECLFVQEKLLARVTGRTLETAPFCPFLLLVSFSNRRIHVTSFICHRTCTAVHPVTQKQNESQWRPRKGSRRRQQSCPAKSTSTTNASTKSNDGSGTNGWPYANAVSSYAYEF